MLVDEARKSKIVTLGLLMQRESLAATLATTAANYNASLTSALSAATAGTTRATLKRRRSPPTTPSS